MDTHCRVCGNQVKLKPMVKIHKNILLWLFQRVVIDFDSITLRICSSCCLKVMDYKYFFYRRKSGILPKYRVALCLWDDDKCRPIYHHLNGKPFKYSIGRDRRLNGTQRGLKEELEVHEIEYPPVETHIFQSTVYEDKDDLEETPSSATRLHPPEIISLRRSKRAKNVKKGLNQKIKEAKDENLEECDAGSKGRGVKTNKKFDKGDYVTTYVGKLMKGEDAIKLEQQNYCLYFTIDKKQYCINSNDELKANGLARLMNHSYLNPNVKPRYKIIDRLPYAYFTAIDDIPSGIELEWDYGDNETEIEWMKTT